MRVGVRLIRLLVGVLIVAVLVDPRLLAPPVATLAREEDEPSLAQQDVRPVFVPATPTQLPPVISVQPGAGGFPPSNVPQCLDPEEPHAPVLPGTTPTPIPLYQPTPWDTGETVAVANTNGHGVPLRVAPRGNARILRIVPEGERLYTVGADLKTDRVTWAYVRDADGNVGWVVAHMLTTISQVAGTEPIPPRGTGFVACPTPTPTQLPLTIQISR